VTLCKRDGELLARPPAVPEADAEGLRLWQKLMVVTSERATVDRRSQHTALVERLRAGGARGATSIRGVWGFHGDQAPHGDRLLQVRRHVPVTTIVVDRPERIARSFAIADEVTREGGLVTCETVPALAALTEDGRRLGGLRLARRLG
jgi:PII-like signaling protein